MLDVRSTVRTFSVAPLMIFLAVSIGAQTPVDDQPQSSLPTMAATSSLATATSPQQQSAPKPSLERQFLKDLLHDQHVIWASPFHLASHDGYWLVPLGLGTAALIGTDHETAEQLSNATTRLSISRNISRIGAGYTAAGIAGGFYLVGYLAKDDKARETGLLSTEALIDGAIVAEALKAITQRPRPNSDNGSAEFFDGGSSFPSGHSITAWALATVIANEYHDHRLVQIGAYSLAALVSMSRFTGHNHFLSDVLIGSAMGYGMGLYVYRAHHDPNLDTLSGKLLTRLSFAPRFQPRYGWQAATYGSSAAYHF
jgi:membrane-associated phospholipid phosphatase